MHINPNESNHVPTLKHSLQKSQLPLELHFSKLAAIFLPPREVHFQKCFGVMDELFEAWKMFFFVVELTEGFFFLLSKIGRLFFWQKDGDEMVRWVLGVGVYTFVGWAFGP